MGYLNNRIAVVTGAGQGIGEAIVRRFVREGARVAIAELNADTGEAVAASLREQGYTAIAVQTDVADSRSVNRTMETVVRELGRPSILVNNAGINVFSDPLSCTDEEWRRCFSVDLDGVWYCCRAVLPHMLALGKGSIVNIASVHAFQIIPKCFPYPVAKHGLIGLTRALAVDFAKRNIRVNSVSPAYIATQNVIDYWSTFPNPEAEKQRAGKLHPIGRIGTPEEVASATLFLASDESSFITGTNLMVDGGRSILFHELSEEAEGS
jgi:NAD(P)-dependent dehydrogenase (short-subunit alcohol dehydrogenase family)